jgi:uncharacterized protein YqkB
MRIVAQKTGQVLWSQSVIWKLLIHDYQSLFVGDITYYLRETAGTVQTLKLPNHTQTIWLDPI